VESYLSGDKACPTEEWGREGLLFDWGFSPTTRSHLTQVVLDLENALEDLESASRTVSAFDVLLTTTKSSLSSLDQIRGWNLANRESVKRVTVQLRAALLAGDYLSDESAQEWDSVLLPLNVSFPRSRWEVLSNDSGVLPDIKYWNIRNWHHGRGELNQIDVDLDGQLWAAVYLVNWDMRERVDRDLVKIKRAFGS
jgi:hypothetical protein